MRFALLGDHPDGLAMARALAQTGRHELAVYAGPGAGVEYLRRWDLAPPRLADAEEVFADSRIAAVIVAGSPANRAALLRRALQSERHVLCVHPPDHRPDTAYEAAMIRSETGYLLFPLLPETLHPAVRRLAELLQQSTKAAARAGVVVSQAGGLDTAVTAKPPVPSEGITFADGAGPRDLRLIEMERWATEHVLLDAATPGHKPGLPGWDVLRFLAGEIVELTALAADEELSENAPVLLTGRFQSGRLFQMALLPWQPQDRWRLTAVTSHGALELDFPEGWPGPARLSYVDAAGAGHVESFESWNPWPALVEAFEASLAGATAARALPAPERGLSSTAVRAGIAHAGTGPPSATSPAPRWHDAVRCLELDDAARRSVVRRRASTLEYQQATEEASFKGTMTLVGCALLWTSLMLLTLSVWVPWLGWFIAPVFGVFILMQILRWVVPQPREPTRGDGKRSASGPDAS